MEGADVEFATETVAANHEKVGGVVGKGWAEGTGGVGTDGERDGLEERDQLATPVGKEGRWYKPVVREANVDGTGGEGGVAQSGELSADIVVLVGAGRLVGEGLGDRGRMVAIGGGGKRESIGGGVGDGDVDVDDTRGCACGELAVELLVLVAEKWCAHA